MRERAKVKIQVSQLPKYAAYKPDGQHDISNRVTISKAEWEAIRLCDLNGFKQRQAATEMNISQPTLNRLLSKGRTKFAKAIGIGAVLFFEGVKPAINTSD